MKKVILKYIYFILRVLLLYIIYLFSYITSEIVYFKENYQTEIIINNEYKIKDLKRKLTIDKGFYIDSLENTLLLVDSLEKELQSLDYKRFKLWLETGIMIPMRFPNEYLQLIIDRSNEKNIPIKILVRLINRESLFKQSARSFKGAEGYMQIMPATYKDYDVIALRGVTSSEKNLEIGINFLCYLYEFWKYKKPHFTEKQIWRFVLASYNAGPRKVLRYNGVPPYKETRDYVKYIMDE